MKNELKNKLKLWYEENNSPGREPAWRAFVSQGKPIKGITRDMLRELVKDFEKEGQDQSINEFEILINKQKEMNEAFKRFMPQSKSNMVLNMEQQKPICITGLGDLHLGSSNLDSDRLITDIKIIQKTDGMYAVGMGDWLQNFIHPKLMTASRGDLRPSCQWILVELVIKALAKTLIMTNPGNHDMWTQELTDIDKMSYLAKAANICYNNDEAPSTMQVKYKEVEYLGAFRHKPIGGSRINPMLGGKNIYRDLVPYDFCMIAHQHIYGIEHFEKHGETRIVMSCGSYKTDDRYGKKCGFANARPIMPSIILLPEKKEMIAVEDTRTAALILTKLRELY
jgi:hypothetical protein